MDPSTCSADSPPLSLKKLCFLSGNPRYEVLSGVVEFHDDVTTDSIITYESKKVTQISDSSRPLLCMISVPSFMIHQVLDIQVNGYSCVT